MLGAWYAGPVLAEDFFIDPLSGIASAGDIVTLEEGDGILFAGETGRSYYCTFTPLTFNSFGLPSIDFNYEITAGTGSYNAFQRIGPGYPYVGRSFIPTVSTLARLGVSRSATGGEPVKIDCKMTSLFGGYNTNIARFNFLEITNLLETPIDVSVSLIRSDNSIAVSGAGIYLSGLQRFDFDIHTAVAAAEYGMIIVNTNGPIGAVSAQVSQYQIIDGVIRQTAVVPLKTRYAR